MDKFVRAEDVKDLLNGLDSLPWEDEVEDMVDRLVVDDVVEIKHGKWIWKELYGEVGYMLVCSECEESEGACERFDYCPNCGAIMDLD